MKKRWLIALFLLAMILPCLGSCAAWDVYSVMKVENCEEWVSLRKEPSPYAVRLKRIPLGALVTDCRYVNDEYIYCRYDGLGGYVMGQYLAYTEELPAPTPTPRTVLRGLAIDKLSTRSGPSTTYDDMGTYSVKGQWIRVYCRAWDDRNDIWWVKVGIPYHGETRVLWTGYKRFDKATLPLKDIPIGR